MRVESQALSNLRRALVEFWGEFRNARGPARDDRHDGLVVVARREVEVGNLRGKHQLLQLGVQCD